ncbi:MAG TPA: hypothetical protein V6D22_18745 [Candidatus Obscuribacterales bacterium]
MAATKINFYLGPDTVMPPPPSNARGEETVARAGLSASQIEANGSLNFLPTAADSSGDGNFAKLRLPTAPSLLRLRSFPTDIAVFSS